MPRDRSGEFSTALFERFQRSEKALVSALAEMYVHGVSTRKKIGVSATVLNTCRVSVPSQSAMPQPGALAPLHRLQCSGAVTAATRSVLEAIANQEPVAYQRRTRYLAAANPAGGLPAVAAQWIRYDVDY